MLTEDNNLDLRSLTDEDPHVSFTYR